MRISDQAAAAGSSRTLGSACTTPRARWITRAGPPSISPVAIRNAATVSRGSQRGDWRVSAMGTVPEVEGIPRAMQPEGCRGRLTPQSSAARAHRQPRNARRRAG